VTVKMLSRPSKKTPLSSMSSMLGRTIILLFLLLMITGCSHEHDSNNIINKSMSNNMNNKGIILMIIAPNNFRDEEFFIPKRLFEENHFKVVVASSTKKPTSMFGKSVVVDMNLSQALDLLTNNKNNNNNDSDVVAVVFPGGSGVPVYYDNEIIKDIVVNAYNNNKVIGAICLAPIILAKAGVLEGRQATVWDHSFITTLQSYGAVYKKEGVVVDGNIVTSNSPKHAEEFANAILSLLE